MGDAFAAFAHPGDCRKFVFSRHLLRGSAPKPGDPCGRPDDRRFTNGSSGQPGSFTSSGFRPTPLIDLGSRGLHHLGPLLYFARHVGSAPRARRMLRASAASRPAIITRNRDGQRNVLWHDAISKKKPRPKPGREGAFKGNCDIVAARSRRVENGRIDGGNPQRN